MAKFKKKVDVESVALDRSLFDYFIEQRLNRSLPEMHGQAPYEFFSELFEPEGREERKNMVENRHTEREAIVWPYAIRVLGLARKYITMSARERQYIVRCRESEIFWRGDDMDFFRTYVAELLEYKKLSDEEKVVYRANAFEKMRALCA